MPDGMSAELAGRLRQAGLDPAAVGRLVRAALDEDLGGGADVTTAAAIAPGTRGRGDIVARQDGVAAGIPVAEAVFAAAAAADDPVITSPRVTDGDRIRGGSVLISVTGPVAAILTAERTALNLLCHLSGVATLTRRWVDAVAGTGAEIRDTRKTLPGLRSLQKYAVRCGGGVNHRMSLADAALIKDNHVAAAGSVAAAFAAVSEHGGGVPVEVECDRLDQVAEALAAGAELILLDNFGVAEMAAAVALAEGRQSREPGRPRSAGQPQQAGLARNRGARRVRLEASGGLTLESARAVAETGVDYLAVGALTHSAPSLDIGLDLSPARPTGAAHAADD
jgi:nicotinate-nucleotide pyrophosphorylase (carboxylating)